MLSRILCALIAAGVTIWATANAQDPYAPPKESLPLLNKVDFTKAVPLNETYRNKFVRCDAEGSDKSGKDKFKHPSGKEEYDLVKPYLCSDDRSRVKALLKLADGAIYWDSKMALDVDGSWAAWGGTKWVNAKGEQIKTTDQCGTSMKWKENPKGKKDCTFPEGQVDSDRFPFAVIPTSGVEKITGDDHEAVGAEFRDITKLKMRDMGVIIYGSKWTPAFIADGGPFMRLGEASARAFKNLGEDRCRKWNGDGTRCVGPNGKLYPYVNSGVKERVIFILYPGSGLADMTPENAIATICAFAKNKLDLTGGEGCP
jgi:hypothetical protein